MNATLVNETGRQVWSSIPQYNHLGIAMGVLLVLGFVILQIILVSKSAYSAGKTSSQISYSILLRDVVTILIGIILFWVIQ